MRDGTGCRVLIKWRSDCVRMPGSSYSFPEADGNASRRKELNTEREREEKKETKD